MVYMLTHLSQLASVVFNNSDLRESPWLTLVAFVDPSLLEMNVNAQDTCMTTFVQTRTLLNRENIVNQPPSLQHGKL